MSIEFDLAGLAAIGELKHCLHLGLGSVFDRAKRLGPGLDPEEQACVM